jgi:hypothetical protein
MSHSSRMRFLEAIIALGLFLGATAHARAQTQTLPPNTVLGRTGITPGPATAIPFSTLGPALGANSIPPTLNIGTISGSFTPVCGANFLQFFNNGGAITFSPPVADGACDLLMINTGSAGAITFAPGFSLGAVTGDAPDTVAGHKFIIHFETINGVSTAYTKALQ